MKFVMLYASSGLLSLASALPNLSHLPLDHTESRTTTHTRRASHNGTLLVPRHYTWEAPGPGDVRSPCPMLNTLANHGFLPHNGRGITEEILRQAVRECLNFGDVTAADLFDAFALHASAVNQTEFHLGQLHIHNIIEHDGSFSRQDTALSRTNAFHAPTFASFMQHFGAATTLTVSSLADARARHALEMSNINPFFTLFPAQQNAISGEAAFMLTIWGHPERPVADRAWFEFFFRNERLPVELGWEPRDVELDTRGNLLRVIRQVTAAHPADVPYFFNPGAPPAL